MPRFNHKMAMVPKGFLRYYILKLLAEKPMSGSEIAQEIYIRTEELWKPSPGSIYPLLSRLKEKEYIQEIEKSEPGLKRYMLTEKGRTLLNEMINNRDEAIKGETYLLPFLIGIFETGNHPQEIIKLNKSMRDLLTIYWILLDALRERYSYNIVEEAINIIDQTVRLINQLVDNLVASGKINDMEE